MTTYYKLKDSVTSEPLINGWYAWANLMSPMTSPFYFKKKLLPLMQSYIKNPEIHMQASKDKSLASGYFVNIAQEHLGQLENLLNSIQENDQHISDYVNTYLKIVPEFIKKCSEEGVSLEDEYTNFENSVLRGLIELVYDEYNRPSVNILEPLFYSSAIKKELQQSVILQDLPELQRPFCLSTPRVVQRNAVKFNLPFNSSLYDELYKLKYTPQDNKFINDLYERFKPFIIDQSTNFTDLFEEVQSTSFNKRVGGDDRLQIKYFGHACVLVTIQNINILFDPLIAYEYYEEFGNYSYQDLPNVIDYVVITHGHQDHLLMEHLLQLRCKITNVIIPKNNAGSILDPSLRLLLEDSGFDNIIELEPMQEININPHVKITGVPFLGEHGDLAIYSKLAYNIHVDDFNMLLMADSNNLSPSLYYNVKKVLGKIDLLFLGMECEGAPFSFLYEPLMQTLLNRSMKNSRKLNASDSQKAIQLIENFECDEIYIYAMGQEQWTSYITGVNSESDFFQKPLVESNKLIEYCKNKNKFVERLYCGKLIEK